MFISPAFAQGAPGGPGAMGNILFIVAIFAVFYFLLIRPQQKRAKQHREMVSAVRRGDMVVTAGGLVGKVARIESGLGGQPEVQAMVRIVGVEPDVVAQEGSPGISHGRQGTSDGGLQAWAVTPADDATTAPSSAESIASASRVSPSTDQLARI